MEVSLTFAGSQPRQIVALHAAHAVRIDAKLLNPIQPGICRRRVNRESKLTSIPFVIRSGQDDRGRALAQLIRHAERVEQQEVVADLDSVRRNELGPPLLLVPIGMRRSPMPDTGTQLTHGAIVIEMTLTSGGTSPPITLAHASRPAQPGLPFARLAKAWRSARPLGRRPGAKAITRAARSGTCLSPGAGAAAPSGSSPVPLVRGFVRARSLARGADRPRARSA
jgi:hypothetical protein